jgi:hypothetical protein
MDAREERGLVIAQTSKIVKTPVGWKVPSQSGNGTYIVSLNHGHRNLVCFARTQDPWCQQCRCADAAAAFDALLVERPDDNDLKIWKAMALLEQARAMKDADASGYKPLVVSAYTILQPLGGNIPKNPDWNFAMAKAFWLNDRPTWGRRAAEKGIGTKLLLWDEPYQE